MSGSGAFPGEALRTILSLYPIIHQLSSILSLPLMFSGSHPNVSLSQFEAIFDVALKEYAQKTGTDLAVHPLATTLELCDSSEAVLGVLRKQAHAFDQYRNGGREVQLMKQLRPTVDIVHGLSTNGVFGEGVGLVDTFLLAIISLSSFSLQGFPPAKAIFTGVGILLAVCILFSMRFKLYLRL
jgi:hypothetical protein